MGYPLIEDGMNYLFFAYLVVWVGVAIYLLVLQRRASALERELHGLNEQLIDSRAGVDREPRVESRT
jgi:CcmD family protein